MLTKRFRFLFILLLGHSLSSWSTPIPDTLALGNVRVAIHPSAKAILNREYAQLGSNKKYVQLMLEKMHLFFPVMDSLFEASGVPKELRFLSVQESALNPNAISTSNAVGFWQFKSETARDVGLKVNQRIDERRHIIEATKGALQYFQRNNSVLDNWMSTLLSYRLGLGSLKKLSLAQDWKGKTEVSVDSSTDWYLLRFLAYKHFWEEQLSQYTPSEASPKLLTYPNVQGRNLLELSDELKISYQDLKKHNPWILSDAVPEDKAYTLYHPSNVPLFQSQEFKPELEELELVASVDTNTLYSPKKSKALYPSKKSKVILSEEVELKSYAIQAGDNLWNLSRKFEMPFNKLLEINNLNQNSTLSIGQVIQYQRKVPMVELISKKMDERSQFEAGKFKKVQAEMEQQNSSKPNVSEESIEGPRKISTKVEKESFYIEPAETREIVVNAENAKVAWKDSAMPAKKAVQLPAAEETNKKEEKEKPKQIEPPATHVVKEKETWYGIARYYGISVKTLQELNKTILFQGLKPNQILKLK